MSKNNYMSILQPQSREQNKMLQQYGERKNSQKDHYRLAYEDWKCSRKITRGSMQWNINICLYIENRNQPNPKLQEWNMKLLIKIRLNTSS